MIRTNRHSLHTVTESFVGCPKRKFLVWKDDVDPTISTRRAAQPLCSRHSGPPLISCAFLALPFTAVAACIHDVPTVGMLHCRVPVAEWVEPTLTQASNDWTAYCPGAVWAC